MVLYGGKVVEESSVYDLFDNPKHPYTIGLLESQPNVAQKGELLPSIEGSVPSLFDMPLGCRFNNRCSKKFSEKCINDQPPLFTDSHNHKVACWLYE